MIAADRELTSYVGDRFAYLSCLTKISTKRGIISCYPDNKAPVDILLRPLKDPSKIGALFLPKRPDVEQ